MRLSIRVPYRVKEILSIELPEALLDLKPVFIRSKVNPEVINVETRGGEILVRPSINLRSRIDRSWIYHTDTKICFDNACRNMGKILRAAPLGNNLVLVISDGKSYIAELAEDGIKTRPVNVGEILGATRYIDRSIVLFREKRFVRKTLVMDQGFLYNVASYCIERREGHSVMAYESDGYTRIYFGSEHGGYIIHDTSGSPITCSMGYKIATIGMRDRGSLYIGKGLYLETPLKSAGIAWIPEDKALLLYDQRNGWLLESDLRNIKPVARLPSRPSYLGKIEDTYILMINEGLVALKGSLAIKPEIHLDNAKHVSVCDKGIVVDLGDRLAIKTMDGRDIWSINKDRDALCSGYGDKIICIKDNMIGVVELEEGEIAIGRKVNGMPTIIVTSDGKLSSVLVDGDIDVINIANKDRDIEISIAPKTLGRALRAYVELRDIISSHKAELEVRADPPAISVEKSRLVVSRTGLHVKCSSPGYVEAVLRFRGSQLHDLYRYVARIKSRGKVIGSTSFNISVSNTDSEGEDRIELNLCLEEAPADGDAWLEIAAVRGGLDGEVFHRSPLAIEAIEPSIDVALNHQSDKSEVVVKVSGLGSGVESISVSVRCATTFFEKTERNRETISVVVGGCEIPARVVISVEGYGFRWIDSREISIQDLSLCIRESIEKTGLIATMCSLGGFYKHVSPLFHKDLSPIRDAKILNVPGKGTQIMVVADRYAAYMISILGKECSIKHGYLYPGMNIIDLGLAAETMPLRLSIFDGGVYREYLLEPEDISEMIITAVKTSYKLLHLLGELGL